MKTYFFLISLLLGGLAGFAQKQQGLALTPPMGWNSWNTFGTDIDEDLIKEIADAMVAKGLLDAGYSYLVLDDGWMASERDAQGYLPGDAKKFPNGMEALGEYIHGKGLKYGIYSCVGHKTCAGYPGSRGHEFMDALTYANWGVDYLKYDWCSHENLTAKGAYQTMRDALYATNRPIVFAICEWGDNDSWLWGEEMGHTWRVTGDIVNCWDCEMGHGSWSSLGLWKIINLRKDIRKYSGPGHWNDFDMMEVGNGFTDAENRSHFAMWCMLASPLILGNDVRTMSDETLKTVTNKEVIAVNQDALGIQGFRFLNENKVEIWIKPLEEGDWAMAFVNMDEAPVNLNFDWLKHDMGDDINNRYAKLNYQTYQIRDLFGQRNLGDTSKPLQATIGVHDVLMLRLKAQ